VTGILTVGVEMMNRTAIATLMNFHVTANVQFYALDQLHVIREMVKIIAKNN